MAPMFFQSYLVGWLPGRSSTIQLPSGVSTKVIRRWSNDRCERELLKPEDVPAIPRTGRDSTPQPAAVPPCLPRHSPASPQYCAPGDSCSPPLGDTQTDLRPGPRNPTWDI